MVDGAPCAVKVACTVRVRGKDRDNVKVLPIDIAFLRTPQFLLLPVVVVPWVSTSVRCRSRVVSA